LFSFLSRGTVERMTAKKTGAAEPADVALLWEIRDELRKQR
jgi:hypothetical protein